MASLLLLTIYKIKPWQTLITWLCNNHHKRVSLRALVKSAPIIAGHKWYWFHKDNTYRRTDIVDKTKIIELYQKTPTGELLHDTSLPPRSLLPNHEYEQAHVWETTRKSHAPPRCDGDNQNQQSHSAEDEERAETPKTNPYYSPTVSWQTGACYSMIPKPPSPPHRQGSDPSAFQYLPAPTDRQRQAQVPSIAEMDIQALALLANNRQSMAHPTHPRPNTHSLYHHKSK